jgi:glycosyltransferase involved in cell wall biosynthesis
VEGWIERRPLRCLEYWHGLRERLKILIDLPALYGGGAERLVLNLMRLLDPAAFTPSLFVMKRQGVYWKDVPESVPVFIGADTEEDFRVRKAMPRVIWRYLKAARDHDVLLAGLELESTYLAHLGGRIFRKPVVGWVHIALTEYLKERPQWHRAAVSHVYPRLDGVVCVSAGSAVAVHQVARLSAEQVRVIPGPFDLDMPVQRASGLAPWAAEQDDRPVVVAIGRFTPQKGFDILLRAHKLALSSGMEYRLWILGEGPLRGELVALADELKIADSVRMPGFVANPYPALRQAAVFVMSSRFEGLPVALFEALALGTPCLATDCPSGPAEILDNGRYGLLVPVENEKALADALCFLLRDDALRQRLALAGRGRAAIYSSKTAMPQWESLLYDVHQRKQPSSRPKRSTRFRDGD